MHHKYRFTRNLGRSARALARNHTRHIELMSAASGVIVARLALGGAALLDPANANHAEFSRMVPEKATAFSAAGTILYGRAIRMAGLLTEIAVTEMIAFWRLPAALAACPTPFAALTVQARFATASFERLMAAAANAGAIAANGTGAVVAPVHRVATHNARRLLGTANIAR